MAGILLIVRAAMIPPGNLLKDWIVVLLVYWAISGSLVSQGSRSALTSAAAAYLLGIYVQGQWIHTLGVLGFPP